MNERHRHAGHVIDLELVELDRDRFRWMFFIDGGHPTTSVVAPRCLSSARLEALQIAYLEITMIDLGMRIAYEARAGSMLH